MNFKDLAHPEALTRLGGLKLFWACAIPLTIITIILPMVFGRIVRWFLGLETKGTNWTILLILARDIAFVVWSVLIFTGFPPSNLFILFFILYVFPTCATLTSACLPVMEEIRELRMNGKPMLLKALFLQAKASKLKVMMWCVDFVGMVLVIMFFVGLDYVPLVVLFFILRLIWFCLMVKSIWGFNWLCCWKRFK
jgi:hypothetical protein